MADFSVQVTVREGRVRKVYGYTVAAHNAADARRRGEAAFLRSGPPGTPILRSTAERL
ncbi:hypothetical protein OHA44_15310 [Streptomyces sp. NBC_00144]|uniref:hypothetical protein n=1 Tax=Streptomyces sp. NBC_00144 TaxID=2975665 RepID=UPI0032527557